MIDWQHLKRLCIEDARIPYAITILCALLVLIIISQTITNLMSASNGATLEPQDHRRLHRITRLHGYHFFGVYNRALSQLPETQLPLTLQGTMVSSSSKQYSYALISASNGPTKVYRIGHSIPDGATLKEIHNNYVVIKVGGQLQMLKISLPKLES